MHILYWLLAGVFLLTISRRPYLGSFLLKAAPILTLAYFVGTGLDHAAMPWVLAALILSAGGDIALELQRSISEKLFVVGLGLFLLAHIAYIGAYAQNIASVAALLDGTIQTTTGSIVVLVLIFAVLLARRLYPSLGKLRVPVLVYIGAILLMSITATLRMPTNWTLIIGTLIFMASDACIAVDKFLQPLPARDWAVMGTYYLAQWLIVVGFFQEIV